MKVVGKLMKLSIDHSRLPYLVLTHFYPTFHNILFSTLEEWIKIYFPICKKNISVLRYLNVD